INVATRVKAGVVRGDQGARFEGNFWVSLHIPLWLEEIPRLSPPSALSSSPVFLGYTFTVAG
ncbi:hypothetical protein LTR55_012138, partial [Exophiala xenobiotica]